MFLQSYVVPVCLYSSSQDTADIKELIGSAFFINKNGCFMTAQHIIEAAEDRAKQKGYEIGIVVKSVSGTSSKSSIAPILLIEKAPEPYDVAIGTVNYSCKTLLKFQNRDVEVWQDVATYGYPLDAVSGNPSSLNLNIRCHKGYIQRLTKPEDIPFGENPTGFELSFLLSKGLSGAPLFIHDGSHEIVIGVCVGSMRSETIEDQYTKVNDNGEIFTETRLSINQFGLAQNILPILDWTPSEFNGLSLLEISRL